jgi:hypothetical protein
MGSSAKALAKREARPRMQRDLKTISKEACVDEELDRTLRWKGVYIDTSDLRT